MSEISDVCAREILDSRGNPTVEAEVILESGVLGRAAVPSGASTGKKEALELRDGEKGRYHGKGGCKAVVHVIDKIMLELDGTENKESLGRDADLSVSFAVETGDDEDPAAPLYPYIGGVNA